MSQGRGRPATSRPCTLRPAPVDLRPHGGGRGPRCRRPGQSEHVTLTFLWRRRHRDRARPVVVLVPAAAALLRRVLRSNPERRSRFAVIGRRCRGRGRPATSRSYVAACTPSPWTAMFVARGGDALPAVGGREQLHVEIAHQLDLAPQLRPGDAVHSRSRRDDEPAPASWKPTNRLNNRVMPPPRAGSGAARWRWSWRECMAPIRFVTTSTRQGKDDAQRPPAPPCVPARRFVPCRRARRRRTCSAPPAGRRRCASNVARCQRRQRVDVQASNGEPA